MEQLRRQHIGHRRIGSQSQQNNLRPIVDPVQSRTVSLVIRKDYFHEAKLNVVTDAIRRIIPGIA